MKWISDLDELPPLREEVICFQPAKRFVSGQETSPRIIMGYLFTLDPGERKGNIDKEMVGDKLTPLIEGGTFWAFPYICPQKFVTHWMRKPEFPV